MQGYSLYSYGVLCEVLKNIPSSPLLLAVVALVLFSLVDINTWNVNDLYG